MDNSPNMIYTPVSHVPIGEAVKKPDGTHALRIKNPRTKHYDEISIDSLVKEVVIKAAAAETRSKQGLAAPKE